MIAPQEDRRGNLEVVDETHEIGALCLDGEFDLTNASDVVEASQRLLAADKHVILDLSEATFIDSSVIHALLRVGSEASKHGRVAVLQVGTTPLVERILEITGIERVLPRVRTRSEAIDRIQGLRRLG